MTVPRLELSGALLLAKLVSSTRHVLRVSNDAIHLWSDSTDTLAWIASLPHRWKPFIANRIAEIQGLVPDAQWHHIDGSENPADVASRGALTQELLNHQLGGTVLPVSLNHLLPRTDTTSTSTIYSAQKFAP